jgi:hypothetical protein
MLGGFRRGSQEKLRAHEPPQNLLDFTRARHDIIRKAPMHTDSLKASVHQIVSQLAVDERHLLRPSSFVPVGGGVLEPFGDPNSLFPKGMADLGEAIPRPYDISITAEVRRRAAEFCGKLKTDVPSFW